MTSIELQTLRVFVAVAQVSSYRRAAQQLQMSPSAVSQSVRRLEQHLGLPLLTRSTRSVALSEAGLAFLNDVLPALHSLDAAMHRTIARREHISGLLRLSVPRSAARLVLTPLLARLVAAHPLVQVEVSTDDRLVDIVKDGFDAGVRFTERLPLDMVALPLGPAQRFIVVATPELLKRYPAPTSPSALAERPCIRQRFAAGRIFDWEFVCGGRKETVTPQGPLTTDDQSVVLAAALEGVGYGYVYEQAARPHLESGQLVQVLGDCVPPGTGFALYYPGRQQASPALQAFIALVKQNV